MSPSADPLVPLPAERVLQNDLHNNVPTKNLTKYSSIENGTKSYLDPFYQITEKPIGTRRPIRVACLGAGYSGLMMTIMFSQKMQGKNAELVVYERNSNLGGTWLENRYAEARRLSLSLVLTRDRYPGCKCDIPAHNYAYSFAPKPDWPNYYATSQQIHQYMHEVADKYDSRRYIRLGHSIQRAMWNEETSKWDLTVKDSGGRVFIDHVDVFINAGGVLK